MSYPALFDSSECIFLLGLYTFLIINEFVYIWSIVQRTLHTSYSWKSHIA